MAPVRQKPATQRSVAAKPARGRPSSRDRILTAAADLVAEAGAVHVSLDAVAERAGVSKGGLLYNFPNKQTLLKALVAEHLIDLDLRRADAEAAVAAGRNAAARAHLVVKGACDVGPPPCGLLAAFAENPDLLAPVRANVAAFAGRLRAADDAELSLIAFLAVEGLNSLDLFEINPLSADERAAVLARLGRLLSASEPA